MIDELIELVNAMGSHTLVANPTKDDQTNVDYDKNCSAELCLVSTDLVSTDLTN